MAVGAFSAELWINPSKSLESTDAGLMCHADAGASDVTWAWQLRYGEPSTGRLGFHLHLTDGSERWLKADRDMPTGTWTHVVATYDGSAARLYLDGSLVDKADSLGPLVKTSATYLLGQDGWKNGFVGVIDEARMYGRAISETEVAASQDAVAHPLTHKFTGLTEGTHTYQAFCVAGNNQVVHTEKRSLRVDTGQSDPCKDVSCSGHGKCVPVGGSATCQCDNGYKPQNLTCVKESSGTGTNVKTECHAKGDGVTNDASAIQACLDSHADVFFPKGTYFIGNSRLFLKPNSRHIFGNGDAVIKGGNKFGLLGGQGTLTNVVLEGLGFYRITTNTASFGPGSIYFDGVPIQTMSIRGCSFESDGVKEANAILVVATPTCHTDGITIENNTMKHITRMGVEVLHRPDIDMNVHVHNLVIRKNTFENKSVEGFIAISMSGIKGAPHIEENTISGYRWGIELSTTHHAVANKNNINVSSRGFSVNGALKKDTNGAIIQALRSMYNNVTNNTIVCPDMPIELFHSDKNDVEHNDLNGSSNYSLVCQGSRENTVSWNLIHGHPVKLWPRDNLASTGNVVQHNDEAGSGPQ